MNLTSSRSRFKYTGFLKRDAKAKMYHQIHFNFVTKIKESIPIYPCVQNKLIRTNLVTI